jgi:tripartite-type tricarboxylate transporter receptor subunit TctC
MVTEEMLVEAAQVGDLESLMIWARQGVRVACAEPLVAAARGGHHEAMRCLVRELGADINQANWSGSTPLIAAVRGNHLANV